MLSRFLILTAAFIWGSSFIAQILGMKHIDPLTFISGRYIIGTLFVTLSAVMFDILAYRKQGDKESSGSKSIEEWKSCVFGGIICGLFLFMANVLQQSGLQYTTAGKAAFITAMYIVLVPILQVFQGKRLRLLTIFAIIAGTVGIYFISITEHFTIGEGDLLVLAATIFWALHILACGRFTEGRPALKLSAVQFTVVAILSSVFMFIFETPSISEIVSAAVPIIYAGVLCTGVAYSLQITGQKHLPPVEVSFILSTESIFSLICGMLILGETLSGREVFGCVGLFIAVILSQVPQKDNPKSPNANPSEA